MKKFLSIFFSCLFSMYFFSTEAYAVDVSRLYGNNRYETSKAISMQFSNSDTIILATGENYADALCAIPLAQKYDCPIILTESNNLNITSKDEIQRLCTKNVLIIGGTDAISQNIEDIIKSMGIEATRIFGNNRYETSLEIAKHIGTSNGIFLATGENYADALSSGPIASNLSMPIILSTKDFLTDTINDYIANNTIPYTYIIGGTEVISNNVASKFNNALRIAGNDRYETNNKLISYFNYMLNFSNAYISTGINYPDALAGGALAAKNNYPIILTAPYPNQCTKDIINAFKISNITILGGTNAVSNTTANILIKNDCNLTSKLINVPYISQKNVLPTGCELVSSVMALRYYNYDISLNEFINNDINIRPLRYIRGALYGPSPDDAFVGNPRSSNGYGCYPPVIVNALNKELLGNQRAINTTGTSIDDLIKDYINYDIPVIFWASINLLPTFRGPVWYNEKTGDKFTWISNEHCMVLVGYDENKYYFNDPYNSNGVIGYNKALVQKRFQELGMRSVIIEG